MKSVGKITAKLVIGSLLANIASETIKAKAKNEKYGFEPIEAMRVQGRIDKCITRPSALNPENTEVKLVGEFIATNCEDGEQFHSGTFYPMGAGLTDMMATAKPGSMFALRIFVTQSAKTVQGYGFDFETALEVRADDAVTKLGDAFLSLPAPPKKEQPATPAKKK